MSNQGQNPARRRALISDDDEFFRVALRSVLLDRNGFSEVIVTSSFNEAVERLAHTTNVDIGLFDLNMVGMENWLDLSAVRAEFPEMRLVVVSASRLREDILSALEIGAHGFIHKGLGVEELSRAIALICDGEVYVPPFLPEKGNTKTAQEFGSSAPPMALPDHEVSSRVDPSHAPELPKPPRGPKCSPRQKEIIDLLVAGQSNKMMARTLNLSEGTIKFHMSAVLRLLGANSRVEAATKAMRLFDQ